MLLLSVESAVIAQQIVIVSGLMAASTIGEQTGRRGPTPPTL